MLLSSDIYQLRKKSEWIGIVTVIKVVILELGRYIGTETRDAIEFYHENNCN